MGAAYRTMLLAMLGFAVAKNATYEECADPHCAANCTSGSYTPIGQWPMGKCFGFDTYNWQHLRKCCGGNCYIDFYETPMCDGGPHGHTDIIPVDQCTKRNVVERYWDPRGFFQTRRVVRYVDMQYRDASRPCPTPAPPPPRPTTFHRLVDVTVQPAVELGHVEAQDADECRKACLAHTDLHGGADCVAFTMPKGSGRCSLKWSSSPMVEMKDAVTYILGNWSAPAAPAQCGSPSSDCGTTPCCPGITCHTVGGMGVQHQVCMADKHEVVV